jgi:hypothetical protein
MCVCVDAHSLLLLQQAILLLVLQQIVLLLLLCKSRQVQRNGHEDRRTVFATLTIQEHWL